MASYDGSGSGVHPATHPGQKTWPAICVDCGEKCTVPFDPLGQMTRCRACFQAKKAAAQSR